jgi:hypothetical protein
MIPKRYSFVDDLISRGNGLTRSNPPFEVYPKERVSFLTFEIRGEFLALPLLTLAKASLRPDAVSIVLEFGTTVAQIDGRKLDELYEDILLGKVRVIRPGKSSSCEIKSIRISEGS